MSGELAHIRAEIRHQLGVLRDGPRCELELSAGLDRDLRVAALDRDRMTILDDRLALLPRERREEVADAVRTFVRRRLASGANDTDQLVLRPDAPRLSGLPCG